MTDEEIRRYAMFRVHTRPDMGQGGLGDYSYKRLFRKQRNTLFRGTAETEEGQGGGWRWR